jgi:hypothetical protein
MPRGATEAFVQAALGSHQRKMVAALTAILAPHRDGPAGQDRKELASA